MPNKVPAAHLVAGTGSLHAALHGAVQATIGPSSIEIVSLNLALSIAARNTATSKQNVEGTAK
jgi:hypothetical protein